MSLLKRRKALVTGGASGLGLAIARRMAEEGAAVALLDLDRERLQAAAGDLGPGTVTAAADVSAPAEVHQAIDSASSELGGLDILVANAGIVHVKTVAEVSEEDWDRCIDVNLKGAFFSCQAAAPALRASGRGRIVMISSDAGRRGASLLHAYSASKAGMIGLVGSLAGELAPEVTVNCVCPVGVPSTGMGQQMLDWKTGHTGLGSDAVLSSIARSLPMGRNGSETDIANAVLFLASDLAAFITGVALDVDGGSALNVIPGAND